MPPISLSDDEMAIIMSAAEPIPADRRAEFLIDVASALENYRGDLGVGVISRIAREAQIKHRDVPEFYDGRSAGKYAG